MNKRLLAAILLGALFSPLAAAAQDRWDARLTGVTGDVEVHPADGSEAVAAEADMPLDEGDRVVTPAGATAEISLDGESLITVQENSDFTLEKTAKSESVFALKLGSLLAKIQKLGSQRLKVRTPEAVAAVRGTEFGVDVEGSGQSHVGVFDEGRVEVEGHGATEVLTPNQETSVRRGASPLKPFTLKRFAARRQMMQGRINRLQAVRQQWKKMPPSARKRQRMKALRRRMKAIRQNKKALNKAQKKAAMKAQKKAAQQARRDNKARARGAE
jgi:hypothetical protein